MFLFTRRVPEEPGLARPPVPRARHPTNPQQGTHRNTSSSSTCPTYRPYTNPSYPRTPETKPRSLPKPRSYRPFLTTAQSTLTTALSLNPEPKLSSSQTSALRDHLETSPGFRGILEYGLSGPLELPTPPRPIPIQRPLRARPRPEGHPGLSPTKRPPRPTSTQTATLAHHRLHQLLSLEPSCDPFRPHRDQVRHDGIPRSRRMP